MSRIGPYEIVEEIGRGGMGIVFRAIDPVIGRPVAVKTIRLDDVIDPKNKAWLRERLFREAQSAGILSHPNIVTIYQIAEHDELAYIAMEFVGGPNLDQVLSGDKPLEPEALLEMVRQIAAALDYAHSKGIVHRDIKPANIVFSESGDVKITDFGIAKLSLAQRSTRTGFVMGTPLYMSPEQIQGKPVDGRADQFSLAVMVFAILAGEKPFDADTLTALVFKIVYEDPPPIMGFNPTLSAQIEAALQKALAKDPAARFATCTEFWKALARACAAAEGWRPMLPAMPRSQVTASAIEDQAAETPLPPSAIYGAVQHCPDCQGVLPAGLLYCGYCGVSLKEAAARAEEKRAEEERKRIAAEKLAEETRRTEEERRRIAEEQRRVAVERQKAEEQRKKVEAEQRRQEEEAKRRIAEQQRKAAEEKQRREEEEKRLAEARQRADEEERKARLAAEGRRRRLESLRAEGAVAFDRGEYDRAVGWWEEALKLAPEVGDLQKWIAESKVRLLKADAEASEKKEARREQEPGPDERTDARTEPAGEREPRVPQFATIGENGSLRKPRRVGLAVLGSALLLLGGLWIFNHRTAENAPESSSPRVEFFSARPDSVGAGGTALLDWYVVGASRVTIDPGVGEVMAHGNLTVAPLRTTTYELKAFGRGGTTSSAKATLSVNPIALESGVAATLSATPSRLVRAGHPVALSWSVKGATAVSIDQGIGRVPSTGRRNVHPNETTTYTLTAKGPAGDVTRTATVEVGTGPRPAAGPPVIRFWADGKTVSELNYTMLHWDVSNATRVSINPGIGPQALHGSHMMFFPTAGSNTLTLTAVGPGGTKTAEVTVHVVAQPTPSATAPEIQFSTDPDHIERGQSSLMSWSSVESAIRKQRIFVVSMGLAVTSSSGQRCELTPGDIIERIADHPSDNMVVVRVITSKAGDCPTETEAPVPVRELEAMYNNFQEQLRAGEQLLLRGPQVPTQGQGTTETNSQLPNQSPTPAQLKKPTWGPPALIAETPPARPSPTSVWVGGYFRWDGNAYLWVPGRWELSPQPGAVWVPCRWVHRQEGWVFIEGRWR